MNRGERIHNNSSENDELPDGVIALLPLCKIKFENCLFIGKACNTIAVIDRLGVVKKRYEEELGKFSILILQS